MRLRAGPIAPAVLALAAVVGCSSPSPQVTMTPTPATPAPTEPPSAPTPTPETTPGEAPAGTVMAAVPAAGLQVPVPEGWEQVDAEALGDPGRRDQIIARYPGAGALLEAAAEMGERAVPAFAAFDPDAGADVTLTPSIAVLVSQPSVGGPLLDLVAGFVGDAFEETFEAQETRRDRITTPLGEAVRLEYVLPPGGGTAVTAVVYLVGAPAGTLLVSVIGSADAVAALDPDALVAALAPLP